MLDHEGDGLGHVQGRAPAHPHDGVRAVAPVGGHTRVHLALHRVAGHAGERGGGQARSQVAEQLLEHGQRGQALVGDHEGPADVLHFQEPADLVPGPRAEVDEGREAEAMQAQLR